uniref:Uncharacterized protein n=1 Tax=Arundo donax TaxID=35708 RepID=A0A0A9A3Y1_ARUDO
MGWPRGSRSSSAYCGPSARAGSSTPSRRCSTKCSCGVSFRACASTTCTSARCATRAT